MIILLAAKSRTFRSVRHKSTVHQESRSNSTAQQQGNAVKQQDQGLSSRLDIQVLDSSLNMEILGTYYLTNEKYLKIEDSNADR